MFRELVLDVLRGGPKKTAELYALAEQRQPTDCSGRICVHRRSPSDAEWHHELRREQQRLKREGLIELSGGYWKLRKSN
jgi:hypothetical protein